MGTHCLSQLQTEEVGGNFAKIQLLKWHVLECMPWLAGSQLSTQLRQEPSGHSVPSILEAGDSDREIEEIQPGVHDAQEPSNNAGMSQAL